MKVKEGKTYKASIDIVFRRNGKPRTFAKKGDQLLVTMISDPAIIVQNVKTKEKDTVPESSLEKL